MRASIGSMVALFLTTEQASVGRAHIVLPPEVDNTYDFIHTLGQYWQNGQRDQVPTGTIEDEEWIDLYHMLYYHDWTTLPRQTYLRNLTFENNYGTTDELASAHWTEYTPIWSGDSDYLSWAHCDQLWPWIASWMYFDLKPRMDKATNQKTYPNDVTYDYIKLAKQFGCNFDYVKFVNVGVDSLCNFCPYDWNGYQEIPPTGPDDCSNPPGQDCNCLRPSNYSLGMNDEEKTAFEIEVQDVRRNYEEFQKTLAEKLGPIEDIPYVKMVKEENEYPEGYLPEGVTLMQPTPFNGEDTGFGSEAADAEEGGIAPRDGCAPQSQWVPNIKPFYTFEPSAIDVRAGAIEAMICALVYPADQDSFIGERPHCSDFCWYVWKNCAIGYGAMYNGTIDDPPRVPDWTYILQCFSQFEHGCGDKIIGVGSVTQDSVMAACEHFDACNGDPEWIQSQSERVATGKLPEKWVEKKDLDVWIEKRNAMSPSERTELEAKQALGIANFTRLMMRQRAMSAREKGMPVSFKDPMMLKGILPDMPNKPTSAQLHVYHEVLHEFNAL